MNCIVGLDLGQQNDFTAISVLDVIPSKYTRQVPDIDSETSGSRVDPYHDC